MDRPVTKITKNSQSGNVFVLFFNKGCNEVTTTEKVSGFFGDSFVKKTEPNWESDDDLMQRINKFAAEHNLDIVNIESIIRYHGTPSWDKNDPNKTLCHWPFYAGYTVFYKVK